MLHKGGGNTAALSLNFVGVDLTESGARGLERHLQSSLLAILTGLVGWLALTVQDSTVKLATMGERISGLEQRLSDDREQVYTARDALKDFQLRDSTMSNITSRVLALEQYRLKQR